MQKINTNQTDSDLQIDYSKGTHRRFFKVAGNSSMPWLLENTSSQSAIQQS